MKTVESYRGTDGPAPTVSAEDIVKRAEVKRELLAASTPHFAEGDSPMQRAVKVIGLHRDIEELLDTLNDSAILDQFIAKAPKKGK